jgi:hypothetical protein
MDRPRFEQIKQRTCSGVVDRVDGHLAAARIAASASAVVGAVRVTRVTHTLTYHSLESGQRSCCTSVSAGAPRPPGEQIERFEHENARAVSPDVPGGGSGLSGGPLAVFGTDACIDSAKTLNTSASCEKPVNSAAHCAC